MKIKPDKILIELEYHESKEIVDSWRIHKPTSPDMLRLFRYLEELIYGTEDRGEANRKVYKGVSPYTLMTSSHTLKGGVS